jgi:hypothetical protein
VVRRSLGERSLKVQYAAWREANRDRWEQFQQRPPPIEAVAAVAVPLAQSRTRLRRLTRAAEAA